MRKPAGPAAYLSRCASSFRFELAVVLVLVVLLVPYTAVAPANEEETDEASSGS